MKIKPTGRGFEVAATIPRVVGVPTIAPALDDSGEAPLVYESVSGTLYVYDPVSKAWVLAGSGGAGGVTSVNGQTGVVTAPITVANMAALAALNAAGLGEGAQAYVQTLKEVFDLKASTATAVPLVNIAASGLVGYQWVRRLNVGNPVWQSQLTWSVDPSNSTALASDENTGVDDAHPLLTHAECARRTWGTHVAEGSMMIVRHLSNDLVGARAVYNVTGGTGIIFNGAVPDAIANLFGFFNIIGVPAVVYSGTMSSVVQTAGGAAGDNHFTDGSAPAFSNATGRLWKRTTASPAAFWPLKDLTGGVFRVSCAMRTSGRVTLASGNTYSILQLPTLRDVTFAASQVGQFPTVIQQVVYATASTFDSTLKNGPSAFMMCDMTVFAGNGVFEGAIGMYNCRNMLCFNDTSALQQGGSIYGGSVDTAGGSGQQPPLQGRFNSEAGSGAYVSFQGKSVTLDHSCDVAMAQFAFYDATDCILMPLALSRIEINSIGGSGNTGKLVKVTGSGCVAVVNTYATGATSDASPFQLNAVVSATPNLVDFATKANCLVAA